MNERRRDNENRFPGFGPEAFRFFAELSSHNTRSWFEQNRARFQKSADRPLRALITALAPFMLAHYPDLETAAKTGKTLARINKNIFGQVRTGLYHTEYWAAFYRQSYTKQTDIQLYLGLRADGFYAGIFCSQRAGALLERLRREIAENKARFFTLLSNLRFPIALYRDEARARKLEIKSADDLDQLQEGDCIAIMRHFTPRDEALRSHKLVALLEETFETLFPLYDHATGSERTPLNLDEMIEFDGEAEAPQLDYDLDDLKHDTYLADDFVTRLRNLLVHKKQIILYGPPGTGKTYVAKRFAQYFIAGKGETKIIQFHPSYAYEDFIEGIRPAAEQTVSGQAMLAYRVADGIFKRFCQQARAAGKDARFVLIIDEINRGNLARVFGELLYLLEYRNGTVELPYSKESFSIPPNLYIIGTMNTADRSIALVDHALRRRFHFIHLSPDVEVLRKFLREQRPSYQWLAELLARLNRQLEAHGISREYHIGHSHFMSRDIDEEQLRLIWEFTIIPTIEEYFHNRAEMVKKYDLKELSRGLIDQQLLSAERI